MSFISKAEFSGTISTTIINTLTSNNDYLVDYLVDEAVETAKTYLRAKYSADTVFSQTGNSRHLSLMRVVKDITVRNLYTVYYNIRKVPAIREERYAEALQWLQDVQSEKINPYLYGSGTTGYTIMIKAGNVDDQRNNYQD